MIVADSGPLIALARINQFHLLRDLFQTILVPEAVAIECRIGEGRPGSKTIAQALKQGWLKKKRLPARAVLLHYVAIGDGESAAIVLARELGVSVLLDDKAARKLAALHDVAVIGTAGLLIEAKRRRLLRKVKPVIEELRQAGYRLSDELVEQVLARCREPR